MLLHEENNSMDVKKSGKIRHLYVHELVVCIFIENIELLRPVLKRQVECQICVFTTQEICQHVDKNHHRYVTFPQQMVVSRLGGSKS
jgi:hypothetical protein